MLIESFIVYKTRFALGHIINLRSMKAFGIRACNSGKHRKALNYLLITLKSSSRLHLSVPVLIKNQSTFFQAIEAYDVLVALLETEVAASASCTSTTKTEADCGGGDLLKKALSNRRSALSVARHLICRYDKTFQSHHRTDSGMGYGSSWEADSSGYSHTTTRFV